VDVRDLFLINLSEMLDIEQTLAEKVLPELREETTEKHLREAIEAHIVQTHTHVANIERVFASLKEKPRRRTSRGLEGLRRQHEEVASQIDPPAVRDLLNAASAAHTEHYEISAYHALITTASMLGEPEVVEILEENLHDEEETLAKLEKSIPERLSPRLAPA
jgi:ferritin-like metal-binding protein YciE